MDSDERVQLEGVLGRIPSHRWRRFARGAGADVVERLDLVRAALHEAGFGRRSPRGKPVDEIVDLLGDRVLSHSTVGPWLRAEILRALPVTKWEKLVTHYRERAGARAVSLHGNMTQDGAGSDTMAEYWHQGGRWARSFCEIASIPDRLAMSRGGAFPDDEEIASVVQLPPLHDFQSEVYARLRRLFHRRWGTAMLSLPTGAGKTRVAVEAVLDHLAEDDGRRNIVLWIAQSDEVQRQAWECFRHVWQTPPARADGSVVARPGVLQIVRAWGSREPSEIVFGPDRTVVIAGVQQLASWVDGRPEFFETFPYRRIAAVIVDEAHRILTEQHRIVLVELGLRAAHRWKPRSDSPPVVGLTATPWRTIEEQNAPLHTYFRRRLITPDTLLDRPIQVLQKRKILSKVRARRLRIADTPEMTWAQQRKFEQFKELPPDYLKVLGRHPERNGLILRALIRLPRRSSVLVFACSKEHAAILAMGLNRAFGKSVAALVTAETARSERLDVLDGFKKKRLRFLCNVNVLTTGFDAPQVDVVCITRPTTSALLYEQMVGRGMRGPRNGGTTRCMVLDVQDEGLPAEIMSYARVVKEWAR